MGLSLSRQRTYSERVQGVPFSPDGWELVYRTVCDDAVEEGSGESKLQPEDGRHGAREFHPGLEGDVVPQECWREDPFQDLSLSGYGSE